MCITLLATYSRKVICKPKDVFESYRIRQQATQVIQFAYQLLG